MGFGYKIKAKFSCKTQFWIGQRFQRFAQSQQKEAKFQILRLDWLKNKNWWKPGFWETRGTPTVQNLVNFFHFLSLRVRTVEDFYMKTVKWKQNFSLGFTFESCFHACKIIEVHRNLASLEVTCKRGRHNETGNLTTDVGQSCPKKNSFVNSVGNARLVSNLSSLCSF